MELVILGSGTVAPSPVRTAPSYWVSSGEVRLLLDCGAGFLHRAAQFDIPWFEVTHVAVTHFHPDHWGELPMLIFALKWAAEPARATRLVLIGPVGLRERFSALASAYGDWILSPGYEVTVEEIEPGMQVSLDQVVTLESCSTPHTGSSLAYAVSDGVTRLVYTGDTGPSEDLGRWAHGCDLLLAECSLPDDRAVEIHLTPTQAGELARSAAARRLVLTHFYPPVEDTDPVSQAAAVFQGNVSAASDGERFAIGME